LSGWSPGERAELLPNSRLGWVPGFFVKTEEFAKYIRDREGNKKV